MTVEDYINDQTTETGTILRWLRSIINNAAPGVREEVKWKVPFYTYQKRALCYLNVLKTTRSSQPVQVELAFSEGKHLPDEDGRLQGRGRKLIKSLIIETVADGNEERVRTYVQEALLRIEQKERHCRASTSHPVPKTASGA